MVSDTCVPNLIVIGTAINQLETKVSLFNAQHFYRVGEGPIGEVVCHLSSPGCALPRFE